MPWWAILYLVVFVVFIAMGDILSIRDREPWWRILCNSLGHFTFAVLFAGFWLVTIHRVLGLLAPVLFLAAVVWELGSAPTELRKIWTNSELSLGERLGLIVMPPLVIWPLIFIAGRGVFREWLAQ